MANSPEYQRGSGPDQLAYGQATELNKQSALARQGAKNPSPEVKPNAPVQSATGPPTSGMGSVLLRPTDRPQEPITQGSPFGEGTNFLKQPEEDSRNFVKRIATQIASSPATSSRSKAFLARVSRGE